VQQVVEIEMDHCPRRSRLRRRGELSIEHLIEEFALAGALDVLAHRLRGDLLHRATLEFGPAPQGLRLLRRYRW
jgi:hypothetical protein